MVLLWQMMLSLMFLWCDKIALQLQSLRSSYAWLVILEINWRFDYDLCDQVAIWLRSERIATDICARESTEGDFGDLGDLLLTNQRSISILLGDLGALHGNLTDRCLVEWGYYRYDIMMLQRVIKSPRSGVTLCFQFVSAAAKTFPSHVKTVWAKPLIFGTKNIWVWGNVLDDLSMTLTQAVASISKNLSVR